MNTLKLIDLADSYTHPGPDGEPVRSLREAADHITKLRARIRAQRRELSRVNAALAKRQRMDTISKLDRLTHVVERISRIVTGRVEAGVTQ